MLVCSLQIIVDDNFIVHAIGLGEFELLGGLSEAFLDARLGLSPSTAQASFEDFDGWWGNEDVASRDIGSLDLLDTLSAG